MRYEKLQNSQTRIFQAAAAQNTLSRRELLGVAAAVASLSACKRSAEPVLKTVVCTTTMLADLVRELSTGIVGVYSIMSPGGDPHLYQPTPADARAVATSVLVVSNGLGLEGWIDELTSNAGGMRPNVVASTGVNAIQPLTGGVDPHFWFDVNLWRQAASTVAGALAGIFPEAAAVIEASRLAYDRRLALLDDWIRASVATIPEKHRIVLTSHDAFHYFGRAYGVQVQGLQGVSTEHAAGQRDVIAVIETVRASGVPAIFVETSVNPVLMQQVARATGVRIAGPLHSDSLGPAGTLAATYLGMVQENTTAIVLALGGSGVLVPTEVSP